MLWGNYDVLAALPPFLGGGEMIEIVRMTGSTYAKPPHRFEAGTRRSPRRSGWGVAVDYLTGVGMEAIAQHEREITAYLLQGLQTIDGLRILGPTEVVDRGGAVSFDLGDIHPHDVSQMLDAKGGWPSVVAITAPARCTSGWGGSSPPPGPPAICTPPPVRWMR